MTYDVYDLTGLITSPVKESQMVPRMTLTLHPDEKLVRGKRLRGLRRLIVNDKDDHVEERSDSELTTPP